MRNPFQFKQFIVHQQYAAMPVTTDACVFGALIGSVSGGTLLDIGCGTGLLSLMMAQRFPEIVIHGVEIDELSANEANKNVQLSPWANRITISMGDINRYTSEVQYDTVICNPPFFNNQLESAAGRKRAARHTSTLTHTDLIENASRLLAIDGDLWLLIPTLHVEEIKSIAVALGFYLHTAIYLCSSKHKQAHVVCANWRRNQPEIVIEERIIHFENGELTAEYTNLLQPFYLHL